PLLCRRLELYDLLIERYFVNHMAPAAIYILSLHDALPIFGEQRRPRYDDPDEVWRHLDQRLASHKHHVVESSGVLLLRGNLICADRKSTRLNSSHVKISYAVFCLKKNTLQLVADQIVASDV